MKNLKKNVQIEIHHLTVMVIAQLINHIKEMAVVIKLRKDLKK